MDEPFLGAIFMFAGNFAPLGFALCNGQLLQIAENAALYSLLGTTYGGDGQSTFALPNLQGRLPVHVSNAVTLGTFAGVENVILNGNQMPIHTHAVNAVSGTGNQTSPAGNLWAATSVPRYAAPGTLVPLASAAISATGSGQPHENMPPFLSINFIIALQGIFPSQN